MAVKLSPIWVGTQFFDSAGKPLSGGKINTYLAGTTTPQATFTDSTGVTPNANPIILDSAGRYSNQIWLTTGLSYKFVLTDANNVTILTEDNISGVNDTTSGVTSEWLPQSTPTYISATSFSVAGNQTAVFQPGRRVQAVLNSGNVYSTILTSVFGAVTTVTVTNDSTALDNTLSAVSVGLLGESNPSVPALIPYNVVAFRAHRTTNQTSGTTVIFDTVDNQSGGTNYASGTGVFTAPFTGWYVFGSVVEVQNTTGSTQSEAGFLVVNAINVCNSSINQATATFQTITIGGVPVFVTAGNSVSIVTNFTMSATQTVVGGTGASVGNTDFYGAMLYRTA